MTYSTKYPVGSRVYYHPHNKVWGTVVAFEDLNDQLKTNCVSEPRLQVWATWDSYPEEHGFMFEHDVHSDENSDIDSPLPLKGYVYIYPTGLSPIMLPDLTLIASVSWTEGEGFPPLPAPPEVPLKVKVKKAKR